MFKLELNNKLKQYFSDIKNITDNNIIFDSLFNINGISYRSIKSKGLFCNNTRNTLRINIGSQEYYIKKFDNKLKKTFSKLKIFIKYNISCALDEYEAIYKLKEININTLDIAAYGERSIEHNYQSFIITQAIEPNISLEDLFGKFYNNKKFFKLKRKLIKQIAINTRVMHSSGLNHRDYYICHYLLNIDGIYNAELKLENLLDINHDELLNRLYLIDLHRVQIRDKTPSRYIIKDLSAMLFSVRNYKITKTDYFRFVKYYFEYNIDTKNNKKTKYLYISNSKIINKSIRKASRIKEKD